MNKQEKIPSANKRRNPKKIGNSWEREFCKILSKWVSPQSEDLLFWRSASSGALATIRNKKKLNSINMDGDITCLDPQYADLTKKIYFECKTVKSNEFNFWDSPKSNYIYHAIEETFENAYTLNKIPFLAIKIRNGKTPKLIVIPESIMSKFVISHNYCVWSIGKKNYSFVIVKMDSFFQSNKWEMFTDNSLTN